jgi:Sulfotransferase family
MSAFQRLHARIGELGAVQMFFIGGSMKSGSTWMQLLLDAHPQVACKGEGHVANHLAQLLLTSLDQHNQQIARKNRAVFAELASFPLYTRDDLSYLIAASLLLAFTKSDIAEELRAVGEKTPDNVRYFEVLQAIFPAAKFLHVVRDGRDCAVSGWFHNLRASPDWTRATFPSLPAYAAMFAREWADDIAHADRFAALCPQACLTVRYERLLADTASVLREVFSFLGVPAGAEVVAQCRDAAAFERLSAGRARGEENRDSFFRNGTRGNWREHLDEAANRAFIAAATPWLERLGYL